MFDAYHKWLGILPKDQPPHHYRLLNLELFETDPDVIEGAADRAMGFVRQYQSGNQGAQATKLLNEIAAARLCLLKPKLKAEYDAKLRAELERQESEAAFPSSFDLADEPQSPKAKSAKSPPRPPKRPKPQQTGNPLLLPIGIGAGVLAVAAIVIMLLPRSKPQAVADGTNEASTAITATVVAPKNNSVPPSEGQQIASTSTPAAHLDADDDVGNEDLAGQVVNLVSAIDLDRDVAMGEWKQTDAFLSAGANARLMLPTELPPAYRLNIEVTRMTGNDGICLGLPLAGREAVAVFDGGNSKYSGLCVDGREPSDNCTSRLGALFSTGQTSTILVVVDGRQIKASVDGRPVINWTGDPQRLYLPQFVGVPNRQSLMLGTLEGEFQVQSIRLAPVKPRKVTERPERLAEVTDVMPWVGGATKAQRGGWRLDGSVLHSPDGPGKSSRFVVPVEVPREYTFSGTVELAADAKGRRVFVIGLVAGETYCNIPIVDVDDCLGLETIDGIRWDRNETRTNGKFLEPKTPVEFQCTVTRSRIRMELNGRTVIDWAGDFKRLGSEGDWAPEDARKIYLGSEAHYQVSNLKIGPPVELTFIPTPPPKEPGTPLNLLPLISVDRDALSGPWSVDSGVLTMTSSAQSSKLILPVAVPEEYQLTMRVQRERGGGPNNQGMIVNLPIAGCLGQVFLDTFGSSVSGVAIDRLPLDHPANVGARRLQAIPQGDAQILVMTVRKTGIKVTSGTRTIVDWIGNPQRLTPQAKWATPGNRISIVNDRGRFQIDRLELETLEPSSFPAVKKLGSDGNLLAVVDVQRDSRRGQWTRLPEGLVGPSIQGSRLTLPVRPPERYLLSAEIERKRGTNQICLGLIVGGVPCQLVIDGGDGSKAGLERLDGDTFDLDVNPTNRRYPPRLLPPGKKVAVQCVVLPDTVIVNCGEQELIRWHGDPRRFSAESLYQPANESAADRDQLWVGAWDSEFLIRQLNLKPLDEAESARILAEFSGVYPTTSQSKVPLKGAVPVQPANNSKQKLQLTAAKYNLREKYFDVTERLAAAIEDDRLQFVVDDSLVSGIPEAEELLKSNGKSDVRMLRLNYLLNGKETIGTYKQFDVVQLEAEPTSPPNVEEGFRIAEVRRGTGIFRRDEWIDVTPQFTPFLLKDSLTMVGEEVNNALHVDKDAGVRPSIWIRYHDHGEERTALFGNGAVVHVGSTVTPPTEGGRYLIVNALSGRCLTVNKESAVQGEFLQDADAGERWRIVPFGDTYKLINDKSSKVLGIEGAPTPGRAITENKDLKNDEQRWVFVPSGSLFEIKTKKSALVMGVQNNSKDENQKVILVTSRQAPDHLWRLQRLPGPGGK